MLFSLIKNNRLFLLMFSLVCLLNVSYSILKSARSALAVVDLGGGASSIPWNELCGTMPGAVIMTLILTLLLNRYSIERVFFTVLLAFTVFFLSFAMIIYPLLPLFMKSMDNVFITAWTPSIASMIFFVMAELWKIGLLTVLFWGLINRYIPLQIAKKYYAPLMFGGSIGMMLASPLTSLCTSSIFSAHTWADSLSQLMWMISFLSAVIAYLFYLLLRILKKEHVPQEEQKKEVLSFWSSIKVCYKSKYLLLLAWVTVADYIAYALGEIIFLDVLKHKFPNPKDYCDFMGKLSLYNGFLTAMSALILTPYLLKHCRWVVASLVTPICLLLTEGMFFFVIWHPTLSTQIDLLVLLGTAFYCLVRAAKYTLFDTSKEISFVLLPPLEKMQGKLVVDGMCARLGRGSGSLLTIMLVQMFGSVLATAPLAGALALLIALSCSVATTRLGVLVERKAAIQVSS